MKTMTLAAILQVCLLMGSPAAGHFVLPSLAAAQSAAPQEQTAPPANPPSDTTPNPEAQPNPTPGTETAPSQEPESGKPAPATKPTNKPAATKKPAASTAHKTSTSPAKRRRKHPAVSQTPASPPKVVVKNGGATEPTLKISPELTQQQASSQRQSTSQLLAGTYANLKKISGAQLNPSQQDMVKQIQQYTEEAKAAGDAGDLERQHNLALKANLLSAELAKH